MNGLRCCPAGVVPCEKELSFNGILMSILKTNLQRTSCESVRSVTVHCESQKNATYEKYNPPMATSLVVLKSKFCWDSTWTSSKLRRWWTLHQRCLNDTLLTTKQCYHSRRQNHCSVAQEVWCGSSCHPVFSGYVRVNGVEKYTLSSLEAEWSSVDTYSVIRVANEVAIRAHVVGSQHVCINYTQDFSADTRAWLRLYLLLAHFFATWAWCWNN
jgi:hypothetical protein